MQGLLARALIVLMFCSMLGVAWGDQQRLAVGTQTLHLEFDPAWPDDREAVIGQWLRTVGQSMTSVYGELPLPDIWLRVRVAPDRGEAVPWANVNRGDQPGITFHVDPAASLQDLLSDWTAYHEFSHLFIPYPGNRDIWFSEGLASYYQNVVQARVGVLTPAQAWNKLLAGFQRGAADTRMSALSLAELSPRMRSTGSFMRVYWSGAYYFLAVDLALRRRGNSLDAALAGLRSCCLALDRRWTAAVIARRLDEITGGDEFTGGLQQVTDSRQMPEFRTLLERHGLSFTGGTLSDQAAPAYVRSIMHPGD